ncbi:helix-turn-helix domain-containing protein [Paenibacillus sp. GYB004]
MADSNRRLEAAIRVRTGDKRLSAKTAMRLKIVMLAAMIAIVPVLVVGWTAYTAARGSLVREVENYNHMLMKQVQQRTDKMMETVDRAVMQHVMDDALTVLLKDGTLLSNEYELGQVKTALSAMETLIDHAEAVYLFVPEEEVLVTSDGIDSLPERTLGATLYQAMVSNKELSFWHDRLAAPADPGSYGVIQSIGYARRLPSSFSSPLGYFVVLLREQAMFDVLEDADAGQAWGMLAVSPAGNVYADDETQTFIGEHLPPEELKQWLSAKLNDGVTADSLETVGGRDWLVHARKSAESGWTYMSIVPFEELTRSIGTVRRIVTVICIALASISLVTILLLTTNLYNRVRRVIERLQFENTVLERRIGETEPELRAYWVQRWLHEPFGSDIGGHLEGLGIELYSRRFTAVCVEADELRDCGEIEAGTRSGQLLDLLRRLNTEQVSGHYIRMGNDRIAGVLIQRTDADSATEWASENWGAELLAYVELEALATISVGIGKTKEAAEDVSGSFDEAQRALRQRLVDPERKLFLYGLDRRTAEPLEYPFEQEKMIVAQLKLGDREKAAQALRDFVDTLLAAPTIGERQANQAFAMLLASILRLLFDGNSLPALSLLPYNGYERLKSFRTVEEIIGWLEGELFVRIVEQVTRERRMREGVKDDVIRQTIAYVQHHYDRELSLGMLAELTGMPETQLSQLFKREVGLTFTDYLISFRVEKAKELLRSTEMKVADIAERMNYNNSQNFIRVFKRIAGMTPGEYRKRYHNAAGGETEGERSRT